MKKTGIIFAGIFAVIVSLSSCASLQQDIHTYAEENSSIYSSIEVYENRFIKVDVDNLLNNSGQQEEINELLTDIANYKISTKVTEPYLNARLRAFEGLLQKMAGRTSEAQTAYSEARGLQKGDRYVQLLGCRLAKTIEDSLNQVETILTNDSKNAVLELEKGKLLYQLQKYDQAIAVIDNAFILFDAEGLHEYRDVYNSLRSYIWDLNSVYGNNVDLNINLDAADLQSSLDLESLVNLTLENTSLLDNIRSTNKNKKLSSLITTLEKSGYFSSAKDPLNVEKSSQEMLGAEIITRKMCARFIWNAYIRKNSNIQNISKYSEKYRNSGRTKSPVADVLLEDPDFDAVLGVIEGEIMELPNGRHFDPDTSVTKLQFINWIKKADKS